MSATLLHREIKPGTKLERSFVVNRAGIDEEARTVELAFSSEAEYERWWGIEILDHSARAVDLSRLKRSGPILMDHDTTDHVGVIESVRIDADDRVGRCIARFGKSARASEVFQDVLDGIRTNVSVGYIIHEAKMVSEKDGVGTYRVTRWEPYEVSLVAVPADPSVGVGRALEDGRTQPPPEFIVEETRTMSDPVNNSAAPAAAPAAPPVDVRALEQDFRAKEMKRIDEIGAMKTQFKSLYPGVEQICETAIRAGASVEQARADVMAHMSSQKPAISAEIGMTAKETKSFSLFRMLYALSNPTDQRAWQAAAFEFECSRAARDLAEKSGRQVRGIASVPYDVLVSTKRDLNVGTASAGGNLVANNLQASDFITLLRDRMVMGSMGIRMMGGLVGNVSIPRQTGGATFTWVAEAGTTTESQATFDQVTLSPKTLTGRTDITRRLMLQATPDAEMLVRQDLLDGSARALELAIINGSGASNQPRGILNTVGIGDVAGGTNGLIPTWGNIVELETDVAVANADLGSLGYLTNAKVRGRLKSVEKAASTGMFVWGEGGEMNGYQAAVTNLVPSNLTKGSANGICSAIIFGNFADVLVGMWGGIDLQVDPYTNGDSAGIILRLFQDADVAIRHPESFSAMKDALTS